MSKKTIIIIAAILTFVILAGAVIIIRGKTEDPVSNLAVATPTNPPDSLPYLLMLNGNLIEMVGDYQRISPSVQDEIDSADFIGITVERVEPNEFPMEELQTNFIGKGCSVYYYKDDSEENYIFIDCTKTNYCFYQTTK